MRALILLVADVILLADSTGPCGIEQRDLFDLKHLSAQLPRSPLPEDITAKGKWRCSSYRDFQFAVIENNVFVLDKSRVFRRWGQIGINPWDVDKSINTYIVTYEQWRVANPLQAWREYGLPPTTIGKVAWVMPKLNWTILPIEELFRSSGIDFNETVRHLIGELASEAIRDYGRRSGQLIRWAIDEWMEPISLRRGCVLVSDRREYKTMQVTVPVSSQSPFIGTAESLPHSSYLECERSLRRK